MAEPGFDPMLLERLRGTAVGASAALPPAACTLLSASVAAVCFRSKNAMIATKAHHQSERAENSTFRDGNERQHTATTMMTAEYRFGAFAGPRKRAAQYPRPSSVAPRPPAAARSSRD